LLAAPPPDANEDGSGPEEAASKVASVTTGRKRRQRRESAMRQDGGLQRAAVVLLQATLVMGILIGCGAAARPVDGTLDLPHFANQAPAMGMETFSVLEPRDGRHLGPVR
jgi:hypothetical protein